MGDWLGEKIKNKDELSLAGTEVEAELGNSGSLKRSYSMITKI